MQVPPAPLVYTDCIFHQLLNSSDIPAMLSNESSWRKAVERQTRQLVLKKSCRVQLSLKKLSLLKANIFIADYIPRNSHWVLLLTMQLLAESHTVKLWVESLLRLKWETAMVLRKTWVFNLKLCSKQYHWMRFSWYKTESNNCLLIHWMQNKKWKSMFFAFPLIISKNHW